MSRELILVAIGVAYSPEGEREWRERGKEREGRGREREMQDRRPEVYV